MPSLASTAILPATLTVRDKFTGDILAELEQCSVAQVTAELDKAHRAAEIAARLPRHLRGRILDGAAASLEADAEHASRLIVAEAGKTIRQARKEVARAVNTLRLSAVEARRNAGEVVPFDAYPGSASHSGWFTREPLGLIAAITPYNDALNLVAHKLGPAIAGGNPVVLKPSQLRPPERPLPGRSTAFGRAARRGDHRGTRQSGGGGDHRLCAEGADGLVHRRVPDGGRDRSQGRDQASRDGTGR